MPSTSCGNPTTGCRCRRRRDPTGSSGISLLKLRAGTDGESSVLIKGAGQELEIPYLYLSTPVTVELKGTGGPCWSATYDHPRRSGIFDFLAGDGG